LRKLIAFDDDTLDKLTQRARDRMATFQELAGLSKAATPKTTKSKTGKTPS
jgi:hypothetical protein